MIFKGFSNTIRKVQNEKLREEMERIVLENQEFDNRAELI